ncbi:reverse transcriptase domain-containing protein, partial [Klebsiella pneumoniae]|uniref:reverse transcriptase domain-containing protein n=1 Tax=Klebsiella pneumoniae TaxID=573 RepID=UPI002730BE1F
KALNSRLIKVSGRLISSNQTTFMKGRHILESVVAAHEIIHEVEKKEEGIILKIDYEKAYDKVN